MVKQIAVGDAIINKTAKQWNRKGKVIKVHGTARSKKFDVMWADKSIDTDLSSRAICHPQQLPKIPPKRASKTHKPPTSTTSDGQESSSDDGNSVSSSSSWSDEGSARDDAMRCYCNFCISPKLSHFSLESMNLIRSLQAQPLGHRLLQQCHNLTLACVLTDGFGRCRRPSSSTLQVSKRTHSRLDCDGHRCCNRKRKQNWTISRCSTPPILFRRCSHTPTRISPSRDIIPLLMASSFAGSGAD